VQEEEEGSEDSEPAVDESESNNSETKGGEASNEDTAES